MDQKETREEESRRIFAERVAQLRIYPGFTIPALWFPNDGSGADCT